MLTINLAFRKFIQFHDENLEKRTNYDLKRHLKLSNLYV